MTSLERTLATVRGETPDRLAAMPIFMIWAAQNLGRSYADYVRDYRVLVEAQLRLLHEFPLDTVQTISDAWREAADCGTELVYYDDSPPACREHLLADKGAFARLRRPDPLGGGRMTDRVRACAALGERVGGDVPILGWVEGPIAEGADLRGMNAMMLDLVDDPAFVEELFDWIAELEIAFARAQIEAGADVIGMGDAAASLIGPGFYERYVLPREQRIFAAVHEAGALARLHICGDTNGLLPLLGRTGADIVDLDYPVDLEAARRHLGPQLTILGNFDPVRALQRATPEAVFAACRRCHRQAGPPYIVGPGCEVPPGTPRANIEAMFNYAAQAAPSAP